MPVDGSAFATLFLFSTDVTASICGGKEDIHACSHIPLTFRARRYVLQEVCPTQTSEYNAPVGIDHVWELCDGDFVKARCITKLPHVLLVAGHFIFYSLAITFYVEYFLHSYFSIIFV